MRAVLICMDDVRAQSPEDEELMFMQRASVYVPVSSESATISFIVSSDNETIWYTDAWKSFVLPLSGETHMYG
jgi:hypothetical protein